jgi:hypothetical protein
MVVACTLVLATGTANADRVASTGFFAETGLGATGFLPSVSADAAWGPGIAVRVGNDLFSWLSLGAYVAPSSHLATVPPPPDGQWFQLYRGGADARLGGRIDRIALFVEGGAGASMISSNVLEKVMITKPGNGLGGAFSLTFHGGGGGEYQLENRHYAVGLAVDAFIEPNFAGMKGLETRLYLRYTYGGG